MVKEGESATSFTLPSTAGGQRSLQDYRGQKLVIFFYPKDETPGCTREACAFRDNFDVIREAGAQVIGISKDSIRSHEKFLANHDLPFELLSDSDNEVSSAYGAYGEKKMYGRTVMGTIRSTFLIDENGNVEKVWSPVRVDGHVEKVVEALGATPLVTKPAKVPSSKRKSSATRSTSSGRAKASKKSASKKGGAKKKTSKRKTSKKSASKKTARKTAATKKKSVKKKSAAKKPATKKKVSAKKAGAKKTAAQKKSTKKKTAKKKVTKKTLTKKKSPGAKKGSARAPGAKKISKKGKSARAAARGRPRKTR